MPYNAQNSSSNKRSSSATCQRAEMETPWVQARKERASSYRSLVGSEVVTLQLRRKDGGGQTSGKRERGVMAEAKALRYIQMWPRSRCRHSSSLLNAPLCAADTSRSPDSTPGSISQSRVQKKRALSIRQKAARLSTLCLPLKCASWGKSSSH